MIVDNGASDPTTEAVRKFNRLIFSRDDLDCVILPLRDGLAVCMKK